MLNHGSGFGGARCWVIKKMIRHMKSSKTILAVIIVLAVLTFVGIACPKVYRNIVQDIINKR